MAGSAVQEVRDDLLEIAQLFLDDRTPSHSPTHIAADSGEIDRLVNLCATVIRRAASALSKAADLRGHGDQRSGEDADRLTVRDEMRAVETEMRAYRAAAFLLMRQLNPDEAWFWKEEWQAGEREADADIAAGNLTYCASDEEFDAALDALDAQRS